MKKSIVISLLTVMTLFCTALCSLASTGMVTADTLKLREQASTDSSVIAYLSANDEVEILEETSGWYKVKSGDNVGYVAMQYINVLTNTNTNTNTNLENTNVNEDSNSSSEENANENPENTQSEENNQNEEVKDETKTVTVLAAEQKLYITPLINSLAIDTLSEEKEVEVVSNTNGWSYVKIGTESGWVRTENIQNKEVTENTSNPKNNSSSQKTVYISGSSVNFRKTPSTSGEVITSLPRNTKVTLITKGEGWSEVKYNGDTGYVSTEYISEKALTTTSRSMTTTKKKNTTNTSTQTTKAEVSEPVVTGSFTGADVVAYAKKYLGYKYVYGASSPSTGFDCSGFTSYVYKHFGVSLSRSSSAQSSNGRAVSKAELKAGDIVCFSGSSSSKKVSHVGLYIGDGKFIHAANSRKGVIISNVSGAGYYFVTGRRVI